MKKIKITESQYKRVIREQEDGLEGHGANEEESKNNLMGYLNLLVDDGSLGKDNKDEIMRLVEDYTYASWLNASLNRF
tara:strand:+ start:380 stop:613 length:234 start_codon:yes stop_codon:yes gene_type:complete